MNVHKLKKIIHTYGANPQYWPLEQPVAPDILAHPDIQPLLQEAAQLDQHIEHALNIPQDDYTALSARIMQHCPAPVAPLWPIFKLNVLHACLYSTCVLFIAVASFNYGLHHSFIYPSTTPLLEQVMLDIEDDIGFSL